MAMSLNIEGADGALILSWLYVRARVLNVDASTSDQYSEGKMGSGIAAIIAYKKQRKQRIKWVRPTMVVSHLQIK